MRTVFEIKGFIQTNEKKEPFQLIISKPIKSEGENDYYCEIICHKLFNKPKRIFGVDNEQAVLLSKQFIKTIIGKNEITDYDGNLIKI